MLVFYLFFLYSDLFQIVVDFNFQLVMCFEYLYNSCSYINICLPKKKKRIYILLPENERYTCQRIHISLMICYFIFHSAQ